MIQVGILSMAGADDENISSSTSSSSSSTSSSSTDTESSDEAEGEAEDEEKEERADKEKFLPQEPLDNKGGEEAPPLDFPTAALPSLEAARDAALKLAFAAVPLNVSEQLGADDSADDANGEKPKRKRKKKALKRTKRGGKTTAGKKPKGGKAGPTRVDTPEQDKPQRAPSAYNAHVKQMLEDEAFHPTLSRTERFKAAIESYRLCGAPKTKRPSPPSPSKRVGPFGCSKCVWVDMDRGCSACNPGFEKKRIKKKDA